MVHSLKSLILHEPLLALALIFHDVGRPLLVICCLSSYSLHQRYTVEDLVGCSPPVFIRRRDKRGPFFL